MHGKLIKLFSKKIEKLIIFLLLLDISGSLKIRITSNYIHRLLKSSNKSKTLANSRAQLQNDPQYE